MIFRGLTPCPPPPSGSAHVHNILMTDRYKSYNMQSTWNRDEKLYSGGSKGGSMGSIEPTPPFSALHLPPVFKYPMKIE